MSAILTKAQAYPTKAFFVSMLTRDIKLEDAILDLIDNCLDGALRLAEGKEVDYTKHTINIKLSGAEFCIEDDCGGIPRDIAANYAFKMGREADDERDTQTETIGMYGVGMKRAMFKMGRHAKVETSNRGNAFEVVIKPDWLEETAWNELSIEDILLPALNSGTRITVKNLFPAVAHHFKNSAFKEDLRRSISQHFTMFLQRGLRILLDGQPIQPVKVEVLVFDDENTPAPFIFEKKIQDVLVSIVVGFNRVVHLGPIDGNQEEDEEDSHETDREQSSPTAGWTVFCNDRAVIVGDTGRLTGWGDSIPRYHPQFAVITGIVEFRSSNAKQLPITTTKRALDASSDIWLEALVKMKEAMRVWITYTNWWKNFPSAERSFHWKNATLHPIREAVEKVGSRSQTKRTGVAIEFNPLKQGVLPKPPGKTVNDRRVVFVKPVPEIRELSEHLFEDADQPPGVVGQRCFELVLSEARKARS